MTTPLPLASGTQPPPTLLPNATNEPSIATQVGGGSKPTVPSYQGSSGTTSAAPSGSNPDDIWGLGDLYGKPVYLGTASKPVVSDNGQDLIPGKTGTNTYRPSVQAYYQQVIAMWSNQKAERAQNPNSLTQYEQLQQALWAGGFYGQTAYDGIHVGQWTTQTQNALKGALSAYEQATNNGQIPMTFTEFMIGNQAPTGGPNGPGATSGAPAAPPQVSVTDPKAIRAAVQQAAESALDHGLSESQLDKFVASFQGAQKSAQLSTAGTVTLPELTSEAGAFVQQEDPKDFQAHNRQSFLNTLVDMFAPAGSQRPGMTPVAAA